MDGWSGDVFVGYVLYYIIVLVSEYYVWKFLGDLRLLLAVYLGLNWKGDMGSPVKNQKTLILLAMKKRPDNVLVVLKYLYIVLKYGRMKTSHHYRAEGCH